METFISSLDLSSDRLYFTIGTCFVHSFTFFSLNFLLFLCYKNNYFLSYKIQDLKSFPDEETIQKCLKHNFLSHFLTTPLLIYLSYPLFISFGMKINNNIPSILEIIRDLLFCIFINDTFFYWGHRFLHHQSIYKYIHKQHHTFKSTIGIASEYAHPIEDLFANVIPTIGGNLLIGSHIFTFWLWLFIRICETIDAHSGYTFPYSPFHIFSWQVKLSELLISFTLSLTLIFFFFLLNVFIISNRVVQKDMIFIIHIMLVVMVHLQFFGIGSLELTQHFLNTKENLIIKKSLKGIKN